MEAAHDGWRFRVILCSDCRYFKQGRDDLGACRRRVKIELGRLKGIIGEDDLTYLASRCAVSEDGHCDRSIRRAPDRSRL